VWLRGCRDNTGFARWGILFLIGGAVGGTAFSMNILCACLFAIKDAFVGWALEPSGLLWFVSHPRSRSTKLRVCRSITIYGPITPRFYSLGS